MYLKKENIPYLFSLTGIALSIFFAFYDTQYFNREILLVLAPLSFIYLIHNCKEIVFSKLQLIFYIILLIFYLIDFSLGRESRATSFTNLIIFATLFYIISPKTEFKELLLNFSFIIKILLLFIIIEQIIYLLIQINEYSLNKYIPFFWVYTSKFMEVFFPGTSAAQSLYLGPQIGSMIAAYGLIIFFPYAEDEIFVNKSKYWFIISIIINVMIFTFTSAAMLIVWLILSCIFLNKNRKKLLVVFLFITPFICYVIYKFFNKKSMLDLYIKLFTEHFIAWLDLDISMKLFGLPQGLDVSYISDTHELGLIIILTLLGSIFTIFFSLVIIWLLFSAFLYRLEIAYSYSVILLAVLFVSTFHYLVIFKSGPALLFSLLIYGYLLAKNKLF
jgi:hypothetical protein